MLPVGNLLRSILGRFWVPKSFQDGSREEYCKMLEKRKKTGRKVSDAIKSKRKVDFDQLGERISDIYDFDKLEPNMSFSGPAIVEDSSTTVVVFPGQKCKVDDYANLHINIKKKN